MITGMYAFYICITWGYDGLAGAIPVSVAAFRKDFGVRFGNDYAVDAAWQLGWLAGSLGGKSSPFRCLIGN